MRSTNIPQHIMKLEQHFSDFAVNTRVSLCAMIAVMAMMAMMAMTAMMAMATPFFLFQDQESPNGILSLT